MTASTPVSTGIGTTRQRSRVGRSSPRTVIGALRVGLCSFVVCAWLLPTGCEFVEVVVVEHSDQPVKVPQRVADLIGELAGTGGKFRSGSRVDRKSFIICVTAVRRGLVTTRDRT